MYMTVEPGYMKLWGFRSPVVTKRTAGSTRRCSSGSYRYGSPQVTPRSRSTAPTSIIAPIRKTGLVTSRASAEDFILHWPCVDCTAPGFLGWRKDSHARRCDKVERNPRLDAEMICGLRVAQRGLHYGVLADAPARQSSI